MSGSGHKPNGSFLYLLPKPNVQKKPWVYPLCIGYINYWQNDIRTMKREWEKRMINQDSDSAFCPAGSAFRLNILFRYDASLLLLVHLEL